MSEIATDGTCWNCKREFSPSLPRNRQYLDYCNPCGGFRAQGDNVKLRAMRSNYARESK